VLPRRLLRREGALFAITGFSIMKLAVLIIAAASLAVGPAGIGCSSPAFAAAGLACCKICKAGKACGDSCIARDKQCHVGKGCACDG
jgi:hypothetical protein